MDNAEKSNFCIDAIKFLPHRIQAILAVISHKHKTIRNIACSSVVLPRFMGEEKSREMILPLRLDQGMWLLNSGKGENDCVNSS